MTDFHLDAIWHDHDDSPGAMELVLTNLSDEVISGFNLSYGAITRTVTPAKPSGAEFVRAQANYHEYRSEAMLQPGEQWRMVEHNMARRALHSNEGPKSAALHLSDGTRRSVFAADLQSLQRRKRKALTPAGGVGLLPAPQEVDVPTWTTAPVHLRIEGSVNLQREAAKVTALSRRLHPLVPNPFVLAGVDHLPSITSRHGELPLDAYVLEFASDQVIITHGAGQGLFYALISLAQIHIHAHKSPDQFGFPSAGSIADGPRHEWRGAHLDVSRQFYPLEQVKRYVDLLAWHKLNRFHWHLTDDEGWRLEIKAYPVLTEVASATGMDLPILPQLGASDEGQSGYYTQDQAAEVIHHAAALGIEVMPEIDLPGHCACVLAALPELVDKEETPDSYHSVQHFANNALNPAMEGSYVVAETILGEVCDLFPFEIIHIGGDEVADNAWMQSPKAQAMMKETGLKGTFELQAYFLRHLQQFLAGRGKKIGGWEELAHGGGVERENCLLFAWTTVEKAAELAEAGFDVISTPGQAYYLDMAQSDDWYEPGASWAGFTPVEQTYEFESLNGSDALAKHLRGVQACVWSEHLTTLERVNYMVFPRLSAIAEAAWTSEKRKNYQRFKTVADLMPRL